MRTARKVVVVAVDFSSCGDDALTTALAMLERGEVERLHLAHVIDPDGVIGSPEEPELWSEERALADAPDALLDRARLLCTTFGFEVDLRCISPHARIGKPVPMLIQLCADYEADLLLVGTHGRRGFERLLMGSVAEALVRQAPCPVLVARTKSYQGLTKTPRPDAPYAPGEQPPASREAPFERTLSTELESWRPSDTGPTGMRIL